MSAQTAAMPSATETAADSTTPLAVRVSDLHKSFGDLEVLKGVSLEAGEGDVIAIIGGYVVQRLIEGEFMRQHGLMHIHVWRRFDSRFRLITARRNPNMMILFVSLLFSRPDIGLIAVAVWTVLSCLIHLVRLSQAKSYSPFAGSSHDQEKTPRVTKETPASRMSSMSSDQTSRGHCSGL